MAEQTNKQNIEDVLSSIRRLVSDEGTHAPRAPMPGLRPEKLVLTPQLRVTEPEDPYQTIRVLGQPEQPLDEMDEASLEDAPDADVLMAPMAGDSRADAMPALDPALERAFAAPADESMAEPEAVETPQGNGEADQGDASTQADETAAPEAPMVEVAFDEASMDEPFEAVARLSPSEMDVATLEASDDSIPQDLQSAVAEAPQDPAPAIPFPQEKVQRATDPKPQEGDDVLDEETLREIIAEVVREEFAGQLGERITRNVRKLVRREIRQILSSEDLD
jgi:hypothetical protein